MRDFLSPSDIRAGEKQHTPDSEQHHLVHSSKGIQMRFSVSRVLFLLVGTIALAIGSRSLRAQSSVKEPTPDSAKALVGTWEGNYTSDHAGPGGMKLVIAKDSVIKATSLSIAMGGEMQSVPVHDFVVTANDISWIQETMGMSCQATAVVKGGQLKGAVVCGHGQIAFTLSKRR